VGKLLYMQTRMVEEAEQEVRAAAEPREATIGLVTDLLLGLGRGIAQPALDVSMAALFGIQIRGILRQPFDIELGMLGQELLYHGRPMRLQMVPDENHRPPDPAPKVLQEYDHVL